MLPGEQPQQAEALQSKVEIKITQSHWVGLSAELLEREQRSWMPGKNMATPALLQTVLTAKIPLAWGSIGVGREGVGFQLQGEYGSECNYMVFINTNISFKENRRLVSRAVLQIWEMKDTGKMKCARKLPLFTAFSERVQKGAGKPYTVLFSC